MTGETSKPNDQEQPRRCPVCGETMEFKIVHLNKVDICEDHGIWLDKGELESIISRLRRTKRKTITNAVRDARKEGMIEMWLFGPLAFLFDLPRKKRPRKKARKL